MGSDLPSLPKMAADDRLHLWCIGYLHVGPVPVECDTSSQGDHPDQDDLGQARAILEVRAGRRATFARVDPIAMMALGVRNRRPRLLVVPHLLLRDDPRGPAPHARQNCPLISNQQ
jgi:hypothetical protein